MAKKPARTPRKKPMQARALRTVDALLDATAQLLVTEGYAKTSTNKVAERAGTSIGTLYEYFPSREALVTAVIERLAERLVARTLEALDQAIADPHEDQVRRWLATMVEALEREARLVRVIETQVPFTWEIPMLRELQRRLEAIAAARGQAIARITGRAYSPETVFLMTTIAKATVLQIATDRPRELDREVLIDEFARLFADQFLR